LCSAVAERLSQRGSLPTSRREVSVAAERVGGVRGIGVNQVRSVAIRARSPDTATPPAVTNVDVDVDVDVDVNGSVVNVNVT
jgi:hypothetical protein